MIEEIISQHYSVQQWNPQYKYWMVIDKYSNKKHAIAYYEKLKKSVELCRVIEIKTVVKGKVIADNVRGGGGSSSSGVSYGVVGFSRSN